MTSVCQIIANPAVTAARTLSDTFAGISWRSAPAFIAAQLVGAALAGVVVRILYPTMAEAARPVSADTGEPQTATKADALCPM